MAASGGHLLQQQKPIVEQAFNTLTNADLKDICKAYRWPVSGTKSTLQRRCIEILDGVVRRGDVAAFEDIRYRANVQTPSPFQQNQVNSPSNQHSASAGGLYNMAPQRGPGGLTRLPSGGKYFKPSPFYEVLETLLPLQDLPEMPQNRNTVKATLTIKPETAQQFRGNDNVKILLYCGLAQAMSPFSQVDITFPNQIEVKVNDQDVKSNYKGLKNKSGSTKPADLTGFMRKFGGQQNTIQITYALTSKRYAYVIYLVRYVDKDKLTERIRTGNVIPKQKVLNDMNKANADPDIAATSIRMSLKDPISTMRITLPVRSSHCTHNQCFDGKMYIELQEQAPQWSCPVCSKSVSFESLCVDKYFEDILNNTSQAIEKIDIEPNGEWKVIREEEDTQPNGTSNKARASYDDDFDDELVELDQPASKPVNGVKNDSQSMSAPSPSWSFNYNFGTPPLSSREPSIAQSASSVQRPGNKRPQGAVIDLTLSDDDEPPRPAKRQSTNLHHSQGNMSNSYNTPTSLPDPRLHHPNHNGIQADNYRPPNEHTQSQSLNRPALNTSFSPPTIPQSSFGVGSFDQHWPRQLSDLTQHTSSNSAAMFPRPASQYAARAPSQQGSSGQQSGMRLPPMQAQQSTSPSTNNSWHAGGWRSDQDHGSYSQSPG